MSGVGPGKVPAADGMRIPAAGVRAVTVLDVKLNAEIESVPTAPVLGDGGPLSYFVAIGDNGVEDDIPASLNVNSSSDGLPSLGYNFAGSGSAPSFPVLVEARDAQQNPLGFAFSNTGTTTEALNDAG